MPHQADIGVAKRCRRSLRGGFAVSVAAAALRGRTSAFSISGRHRVGIEPDQPPGVVDDALEDDGQLVAGQTDGAYDLAAEVMELREDMLDARAFAVDGGLRAFARTPSSRPAAALRAMPSRQPRAASTRRLASWS